MSTQDVLNIFLILVLLTFIICSIITTFFVIKALKAITTLAENLKETTLGLKDKVGLKFLTAIPAIFVALLGKMLKRGR